MNLLYSFPASYFYSLTLLKNLCMIQVLMGLGAARQFIRYQQAALAPLILRPPSLE